MDRVTVKLRHPLQGSRGPITEFVFREPTFEDWIELGDPETFYRTADGGWMQENATLVGQYADRLLLPPGDPNIMRSAKLTDTLAIKNAILGFFREATGTQTKEPTPSLNGSPENSPSDTGSNGPTSSA